MNPLKSSLQWEPFFPFYRGGWGPEDAKWKQSTGVGGRWLHSASTGPVCAPPPCLKLRQRSWDARWNPPGVHSLPLISPPLLFIKSENGQLLLKDLRWPGPCVLWFSGLTLQLRFRFGQCLVWGDGSMTMTRRCHLLTFCLWGKCICLDSSPGMWFELHWPKTATGAQCAHVHRKLHRGLRFEGMSVSAVGQVGHRQQPCSQPPDGRRASLHKVFPIKGSHFFH